MEALEQAAGEADDAAVKRSRIYIDTDAALAHMKLQVYDPTPSVPWSGDEQEACAACH